VGANHLQVRLGAALDHHIERAPTPSVGSADGRDEATTLNITATVDRLRDLPPAIIDLEVEKILLPKTRSKVVLHDRALFVTELHREHLWPASVRSRAGRRA
jgi:hypothetical protein